MIERVAVLVTVAVCQARERGRLGAARPKLSAGVKVSVLDTQGVKMFSSH